MTIVDKAPQIDAPVCGCVACSQKLLDVCGCVACSQKLLDARCPYRWVTRYNEPRCGLYRGHRGDHTVLVATTFLIAAERVRLDG